MHSGIIKQQLTIEPRFDGVRLDMALVAHFPELSRRKIRRVIDMGGVYVNSKRIRLANRTLRKSDRIEVIYSKSNLDSPIKSQSCGLQPEDIIFDEAGLFAISKPAGWPSVAAQNQAVFHAEKIVRDFLVKQQRRVKDFQILHRLDRETSGVLLFSLEKGLTEHILQLFKDRKIKKTYLALTFGKPSAKEFHRDSFLSQIEKSTGMVREVKEGKGGKTCFTRFKVLKSGGKAGLNLIEAYPSTGRSHQIRVHLASEGLPILGDKKYCNQYFFQIMLCRYLLRKLLRPDIFCMLLKSS